MGPTGNEQDQLRRLVTGFRISCALSVAAELGLSDQLDGADGGGRSLSDLATAVGADPDTLARLLRALAAVGVYAQQADGRYVNTSLSEGLRSEVPGSLRPLARTLQDPATWSAWGHLGHSVRTGENAFVSQQGVDVWEYRQERPELNQLFNENMTALTEDVADRVAAAYDFTERRTVVDVGGGHGMLLETVLGRHRHLRGIVFDQEHVVARAPRDEELAARWSAVSGSFFDTVPQGDVHLLKAILHDWPDEECVRILRNCAESLTDGGAVLVVEAVLGRPGYEAQAAFSDLNMLVLPGGRERTEVEYAALFEVAGLRLVRVLDTGTRMSVLEGRVD